MVPTVLYYERTVLRCNRRRLITHPCSNFHELPSESQPRASSLESQPRLKRASLHPTSKEFLSSQSTPAPAPPRTFAHHECMLRDIFGPPLRIKANSEMHANSSCPSTPDHSSRTCTFRSSSSSSSSSRHRRTRPKIFAPAQGF